MRGDTSLDRREALKAIAAVPLFGLVRPRRLTKTLEATVGFMNRFDPPLDWSRCRFDVRYGYGILNNAPIRIGDA